MPSASLPLPHSLLFFPTPKSLDPPICSPNSNQSLIKSACSAFPSSIWPAAASPPPNRAARGRGRGATSSSPSSCSATSRPPTSRTPVWVPVDRAAHCRLPGGGRAPDSRVFGSPPWTWTAWSASPSQGLFEGLKAYRKTDGSILLFRPEQNATRMITGAERICIPAPTVEQFVDAVKKTVLANKRWVPPTDKGSLYIRPLLLGSGAVLGLAPAPEYMFIIFVSQVGNYFKVLDCRFRVDIVRSTCKIRALFKK